jgi:cytochrome c oxidase subunit IV
MDSSAAHAAHDPAEIDKHVRTYIIVFATLLTLTFVTVAVSYLHLELHQAVAVALVIATFKASLVALFFMHLISERQVIIMILALTFAFAVALLLLPIITNLDHITIVPHA